MAANGWWEAQVVLDDFAYTLIQTVGSSALPLTNVWGTVLFMIWNNQRKLLVFARKTLIHMISAS